jgi:hypothetical protein
MRDQRQGQPEVLLGVITTTPRAGPDDRQVNAQREGMPRATQGRGGAGPLNSAGGFSVAGSPCPSRPLHASRYHARGTQAREACGKSLCFAYDRWSLCTPHRSILDTPAAHISFTNSSSTSA